MGYKPATFESFAITYDKILSTYALSYAANGYYAMLYGIYMGIKLKNYCDVELVLTLGYSVSSSPDFYIISPQEDFYLPIHQAGRLIKKGVICAKAESGLPSSGSLRGVLIS